MSITVHSSPRSVRTKKDQQAKAIPMGERFEMQLFQMSEQSLANAYEAPLWTALPWSREYYCSGVSHKISMLFFNLEQYRCPLSLDRQRTRYLIR